MQDSIKKLLELDTPVSSPRRRDTVWELTYDASSIDLPDTARSTPIYEVGIDAAYTPTTHDVFSAWTGPRRIDGTDYHGPVYHLGTTSQYTGPRTCSCSTCQATVAPADRLN